MRLLLDECLPKKLKFELPAHVVTTVQQKGWAGTKNGDLLRLAEIEFDVFITIDKNLESQQNMTRFNIAVVVLNSPSNRLAELKPMMLKVLKCLETVQAGQLVVIDFD